MNKHVLITGAGKGIGLGIAESVMKQGYELDLLVSSEESANKIRKSGLVKKSGANVYALDLRNRDAISHFVEGWKGNLWGIVNNAGICKTHGIAEIEDDPLDEVLETNLIGPYFLTKGLLKNISSIGRIINIASQLGQEGRAGYSAYCASKFALIGMTKCWAKELGCKGITVNAVCPGWVETDMSINDISRMAREQGIDSKQLYMDICSPLELKRFNTVDEVANLVTFLLSDKASGITGRDWLMQTVWNQS